MFMHGGFVNVMMVMRFVDQKYRANNHERKRKKKYEICCFVKQRERQGYSSQRSSAK